MKHLLIASLVAVAVVACGPAERPGAAPSAAEFPPYAGGDTLLFDDTFAPEVFGMALGTTGDNQLQARAQAADSIERVRVATISSEGDSATPRYSLVLVPIAPPLAGPGNGDGVSVEVIANSPSYPLVRSADRDLVGKTFILLSKRYNDSGHIALHWRGVPDTDNVRATVQRARALHDLEK